MAHTFIDYYLSHDYINYDFAKGFWYEDNEFLVDGIVEDIITEFSRLNSIEIISRHSAFGCKNKSLDNSQIVKQFNVNYIATGSIRSSGNE